MGAAGAAGSASANTSTAEDESRKSSFPPGHKPHTLERGRILFFYKPKVMHEGVESVDDVQRFFIVLRPDPGTSVARGIPRLLTVPKKRLPAMGEGHHHKEALWCFVSKACRRIRAGRGSRRADHGESVALRAVPPAGPGWPYASAAAAMQVSEDERELLQDLGVQDYETATRGTRHQAAARLYGPISHRRRTSARAA